MSTTTKTKVVATRRRYNELKTMLEDRRRQLPYEVQVNIRDARTDSTKKGKVLDEGESSEIDIQDDIGFALIQMKAETLNKIHAALRRLGEGTYGDCFECGGRDRRGTSRALPFAVRCKDCEESHESVKQRERIVAQRRGFSGTLLRPAQLGDRQSNQPAGRNPESRASQHTWRTAHGQDRH